MLRIKERLLRAWLACKRLTGLSFPRCFPIVQFPNLPLIVAVLAGAAGKFLDGSALSYNASVSYLAMTIWAYEELVHGVNWFRRLLPADPFSAVCSRAGRQTGVSRLREKRTAAGNGISWPLVTTGSGLSAEPSDEGGTQPKFSRKRLPRATARRSG